MKLLKRMAVCATLAFVVMACVACGGTPVNISLGTYNEETETFTTVTSGYSITVTGNQITLSGEVPYSEGLLGLDAGNIVALKFTPTTSLTPDEETSIQTSNSSNESGWNTYGQENLESDGSVIWVTAVNTTEEPQIKIKWNAQTQEVTYTLKLADDATLLTE